MSNLDLVIDSRMCFPDYFGALKMEASVNPDPDVPALIEVSAAMSGRAFVHSHWGAPLETLSTLAY